MWVIIGLALPWIVHSIGGTHRGPLDILFMSVSGLYFCWSVAQLGLWAGFQLTKMGRHNPWTQWSARQYTQRWGSEATDDGEIPEDLSYVPPPTSPARSLPVPQRPAQDMHLPMGEPVQLIAHVIPPVRTPPAPTLLATFLDTALDDPTPSRSAPPEGIIAGSPLRGNDRPSDVGKQSVTSRYAEELVWPLNFPGLKLLDGVTKKYPHPLRVLGATLRNAQGTPNTKTTLLYHHMPPGSPGSMLLAGASGTGKSSILRGCLLTTCYMTNPEHYQMIIVELGAQGLDYTWARAFPHLTQMITTMPELVTLFSWLQREYQRRLGLFTAAEVGDIADYNQQQIRQGRPVLPLIDVVIDEMAEILRRMVDEDREYCVAAEWTQNRYIMGLIRIGQLYRKTGIITTIATQDPRATSIPRELTTQISTRISLRLQDSVQNRVVLGESSKYDASHLPGIDPITRKHTGRMVVSYAGDQYIGQAFYYTSEQVLTLRDAVIARWSAPKAGVLSEPCAIMA